MSKKLVLGLMIVGTSAQASERNLTLRLPALSDKVKQMERYEQVLTALSLKQQSSSSKKSVISTRASSKVINGNVQRGDRIGDALLNIWRDLYAQNGLPGWVPLVSAVAINAGDIKAKEQYGQAMEWLRREVNKLEYQPLPADKLVKNFDEINTRFLPEWTPVVVAHQIGNGNEDALRAVLELEKIFTTEIIAKIFLP